MPRFIETPSFVDRMPVDISFVFEDEKPAGKHGFMRVKGENLVFEDGTVGRFYGVTLNGAAAFPTHEYAEKLVTRFSQAGLNIVRLHQIDAYWQSPNLFSLTRGPLCTDTRHFNPQSMDRLDYLIYKLKEKGIYVYMDHLVHRKFRTGDGVKFADKMLLTANPYVMFDRTLIDLQKEFMTNLWNHKNPYTGLMYKDEPAIVLTEVINENDIFAETHFKQGNVIPYYEDMLRDLYRDWVKKNHRNVDADNARLWNKADKDLTDFKFELTFKYNNEMISHLKSIGVKIPINTSNRVRSLMQNVFAQKGAEFMDNHTYFYDWRWGEEEKCCADEHLTASRTPQALAALAFNNMPLFCSEWDMPWPNAFRAESPLYYAALNDLQGWSGLTCHTYTYSSDTSAITRIGKESSSNALGGVPYREGIYSVWNDPAKFWLFQHAALMVRRQDVSKAKEKIAVKVEDKTEYNVSAYTTGSDIHKIVNICPEYGITDEGCSKIVSNKDKITMPENDSFVVSDTGEIVRNISKKVSTITTPRTKAVYGVIASGKFGRVESNTGDGLEFDVKAKTDFGTVVLSSLTDEDTVHSPNMLLSAIGRARNTGLEREGDKLVNIGHAPIVSEVICADIAIKTELDNLHVWAINAEGIVAGEIASRYEDKYLKFSIGEHFPTLQYHITAE